MSKIHSTPLLLLLFSCLYTTGLIGTTKADSPKKPNVIFIMADDLGFSDLGCYGSEIETPNLDALAAGGLRFSQFYNTAKCHSSRVSLLTGQYCIAAGDVSLSNGVTSAEVLRDGGYFTSMVGKWHLQKQPTDFGFQRYWGHLSGACNFFRGDKTFRFNGEPWTVPDEGFYTTVANVDYGLKFLSEAEQTKKPWYLYVAFNAPHAPLQALPDDYAKYQGRYNEGWDVIREKRLAKQNDLGLFADDLKPSPRPEHIPAWETLSDARKQFEKKRMTTLAAMIDRVDQEIGRLVQHLKDTDQLDNTLIWFVSDNGACPYDRNSNQIDAIPTNGSVSWSDSTGWAWARNSPFRYYKQNQFEGGIATPSIVHWPAGLKTTPGSINHQPAHLIDVMPTLADLSGSKIPSTMVDRDLRPVSGQTLRPIFNGGVIDRKEPLHFLFASDRGLREGDWKAVSYRSGPWELYNVRDDRTELNNLADQEPQRLASMVNRWQSMARDVLHAGNNGTSPVSETPTPHQHPEWTNFASDPAEGVRGNSERKGETRKPAKKSKKSMRARKNTQMEIDNDEIRLTFTGDDPGIAFDQLPADLGAGPYVLAFGLKSETEGNGEVFFTTDTKTALPNGTRVPLAVIADGQWHDVSVRLTTDKTLNKLRLDVSEGKGSAVLRDLRLSDTNGKELIRWGTK
ncbi:MAG: arylsulfatase [Pirellulaceae bacterium]